MASVTYETMLSEKGKTLIVVDGFKFRFHKSLAQNIQRWACIQKTCKSFLKLDEQSNIMPSSVLEHNHLKDDSHLLDRQKISNSLKRKALDDISTRPSKLLHAELRLPNAPKLYVNDVTLIRKNIGRCRLTNLPQIPKTIDEFHDALNAMPIETNEKENFLLVNDAVTNIVCFSTKTNLETLCSVENIFADGTFYSCPKPFEQLFTIHGLSLIHI